MQREGSGERTGRFWNTLFVQGALCACVWVCLFTLPWCSPLVVVRFCREACKSEYKYLSDRWRTNKSLKTWYQEMTKEQRHQWYQQRKKSKQGCKRRSFDDIGYSEQHVQETAEEEQDVDNDIPWSTFQRNRLVEGKSTEDIATEWKCALQDPSILKRKHRGQWLVHEWGGLQVKRIRKIAVPWGRGRGGGGGLVESRCNRAFGVELVPVRLALPNLGSIVIVLRCAIRPRS